MYFLLAIACLLSTVHANGFGTVFFLDDAVYNPCGTKPNLFYYPDPTDISKYYQCDESGNAYLRSCGELVWDELRVACNWASAVAPPPAKFIPIETTTWPSWPTPSWPTTTSSWPTTRPTWRTTRPTWSTTTTQSSSTTTAPVFSLCKPINPCGEYGQCLESPDTVPSSVRRFACICSENRFGRLCDKHIDELTTPPTVISDQSKNTSESIDNFSLPVKTEKDSKYIFFGLKAGDPTQELNPKKKRHSNRI